MLRSYKKPVTVNTQEDTIQMAREFAQQVIDTVNYCDSNQHLKSKIMDDHFTSKIGEEAAKKVFLELGNNVIGPDYAIYEGKKKTWISDLKIDNCDLAVKTMRRTAANRYGLSWTFQNFT